jgi:hypothetical protein
MPLDQMQQGTAGKRRGNEVSRTQTLQYLREKQRQAHAQKGGYGNDSRQVRSRKFSKKKAVAGRFAGHLVGQHAACGHHRDCCLPPQIA